MPEIAIIGRQNVGKSTLFNSLIKRKIAITWNRAGVTRDLVRRNVDWAEGSWALTDFPGFENAKNINDDLTLRSIERALNKIEEYHLILWVISADGLVDYELEMLARLRKISPPVWMIVNFADDASKDQLPDEYYQGGFEKNFFVSALNRRNVSLLRNEIIRKFSVSAIDSSEEKKIKKRKPSIRYQEDNHDENVSNENGRQTERKKSERFIAIIGKPNSGKSTLYNKLLQKDVSIVSEVSGTTRDVIESGFAYNGNLYRLLDTAGMRKKNRIRDNIERFSVHAAIENARRADIALMLIDSSEGIDRQSKSILSLMKRYGVPLIVIFNKSDLLSEEEKNELDLTAKDNQKKFWRFPYFFASGLTGRGIGQILKKMESMLGFQEKISTTELNKILAKIVLSRNIKNAGIKINYITYAREGSRFIVFGNREKLNEPTIRFLEKQIASSLGLTEIPFQVEYRRK